MPLDSLRLETSICLVHGKTFEVPRRFKVLEPVVAGDHLGRPACRVQDLEVNQEIGLKKIEGIFQQRLFARRTLRELRLLRMLKHENILQVRCIFATGLRNTFDDVYVGYELMESDLASTLRSDQELTEDHAAFFIYQVLRAMKYVHSAEVVHCDLKPRNLLVNSNCDLKICDFSQARLTPMSGEWVCPMTEYVCTQWYRAPEVLCSWKCCKPAIDVWSIGCILAEIIRRQPLFSGSSTQHQLGLLMNLLGKPTAEVCERLDNRFVVDFIKAAAEQAPRTLAELLPSASEPIQDFVRQTIRWCPDERPSVAEGIRVRFFEGLHDDSDEPTRTPLARSCFEFNKRRIDLPGLREELFREMLYYHPHLQPEVEEENGYNVMGYHLLKPGDLPDVSDGEA